MSVEGDQREPWPLLREETAINKAPKLLLLGAKIIDFMFFKPTVKKAHE